MKLYDLPQVKLKTAGNTSVVQFTAGNSKSCPVRNLSKDTYLDTKSGEVRAKKKSENRFQSPKSVRKSINRLMDLIRCNATDPAKCKWLTVTYEEVVTDGKQAFLDAKLFLRKLKRHLAIDYDTTIRQDSNLFKKNRVTASLICSVSVLVILFILTFNSYNDILLWTYQWTVLIVVGVIFFVLGLLYYGHGGLFVTMCYGWVSFALTVKKRNNEEKTILARETAIISRWRLVKCIRSVESILVFYNMLLEQSNGNELALLALQCCEEEKENWDKWKEKVQLLLVAMEYLYFRKKKCFFPGIIYAKTDRSVNLARGFCIRVTKAYNRENIDTREYDDFLNEKMKKGTKK